MIIETITLAHLEAILQQVEDESLYLFSLTPERLKAANEAIGRVRDIITIYNNGETNERKKHN